MAALNRTEDQVNAALRIVAEADATEAEKAEMLMEIAMELQRRPQETADLEAAITLYEKALTLSSGVSPLLGARVQARMATALMAMPDDDMQRLHRARQNLETAIPIFARDGIPEEVAEAEMNLGLVLQNLAGQHQASIKDAISAYQRSLRTFDKALHPKEFAILQNNLATAFLSIPFTDERSKLREALAVQAFEEGLSVVTLIDHPLEYAMLQNNLGNALQYAASSHPVENGFRALEAYDEALKVRTARDTPILYANTIANKANCLANLPDDPEHMERENPANLRRALGLYREARSIFAHHGDVGKVSALAEVIAELEAVAEPATTH